MTETTKTDLETIAAIFLNGKVVKYPVQFNETEGWVEMQVPVMVDGLAYKTGDLISSKNPDINQFHWETIRREGEVKVIYADSPAVKAQ